VTGGLVEAARNFPWREWWKNRVHGRLR
jgi:hypothetical protein